MRLDVIFADIDGFMVDDGLHRPTVEIMNEFAPQHSRLFKEACHSFIHSQFSPSGGASALLAYGQVLTLSTSTFNTDDPGLNP